MLDKFSIIFVILFGRFHDGQSTEKDITGIWYGVMSTPFNDNGDCHVFRNNKPPCKCQSINFKLIGENEWEMHMYSNNNLTQNVTISMGGACVGSSEDEIKCRIIGEAQAPITIFEAADQCCVTDTVMGVSKNLSYTMKIINWDVKNFYMITHITGDGIKDPYTVVFCRKKFPKKSTIWTAIYKNLERPHDMIFISQDKCYYPSDCQSDEINYCN